MRKMTCLEFFILVLYVEHIRIFRVNGSKTLFDFRYHHATITTSLDISQNYFYNQNFGALSKNESKQWTFRLLSKSDVRWN